MPTQIIAQSTYPLTPTPTPSPSPSPSLSLSQFAPGVDFTTPLGTVIQTAVSVQENKLTRRAYVSAIGRFFVYLSEVRGINPTLAERSLDGRTAVWQWRGDASILPTISPSEFDGYTSWMVAKNPDGKATARQTAATGARVVFSVLARDGYLTTDQMTRSGIRPWKRKTKRQHVVTGRRLTTAEVRRLLNVIPDDTVKGKRDTAIVHLMIYAGLRRAEVSSLNIGSLSAEGGQHYLMVAGKGSKTRRLPVHRKLYASIMAWLAAADRPLTDDMPIFVGVGKGGRLTANRLAGANVGDVIRTYAPLAGLNGVAAHDLRRTAARTLYDNGCPLPVIQKFLGHVSIETTMRYVGVDDDDLKEATDYLRY